MSNLYAAIDLGSNSFHLLIGKVDGEKIVIVERFSEKVQLGAGLCSKGKINSSAMARGLSCLKGFKSHIDRYPSCQVRCCGTQALRKAENSQILINEAASLGFDIEVIDGCQEARWVYNGVISNLVENDIKRLVIDIGGGSTELALGRNNEILELASIPIGCVSWREQYFPDGLIEEKSWHAAFENALAVIKPSIDSGVFLADEVYASSGTAKMLYSICLENNLLEEDVGISLSSLGQLKKMLWKYDNADHVILAGLKPQRRDLLMSGLNIMMAMMQQLGIQKFVFSKTALREGMLLSMATKNELI